jgi:4-carboxymuconolactone decarboxylase
MPRFAEVTSREALPVEQRDLWDYLASTRGSVRPPFSIIMNSPEACRRISHLGTYIRFESSIPKAATELATLAVAREYDCGHEWAMHTNFAREAGVSEGAIEAIGHRTRVEKLAIEEALPITFARELLREHRLDDQTFTAARERYGDQGVIDLSATVGYYALMANVLNTIELVPPPEANQLPKV